MDSAAAKILAQAKTNSVGQPIAWPEGGTPEITTLLIEMAPGDEGALRNCRRHSHRPRLSSASSP
jgi:hypothetical protein